MRPRPLLVTLAAAIAFVAGTSGVSIVADVGTAAGQQHITIHQGTEKGHLTVMLAGGTAATELGRPAVAVKATQSSKTASLKLTMYVRTTGAALPILVVGTSKDSGSTAHTISARFGDWGETLHLTAPSGSVSITKVQALVG